MGRPLVETPDLGALARNFGISDDFCGSYTTNLQGWVATLDATSTVAIVDGVGGKWVITTHVDDNDAAVLKSREIYKLATSKPIHYRSELAVSVNAALDNYAFGLCDGATLDLPLANDGGTIAIPNDGILFVKLDGDTVWSVQTEVGTAFTKTATDIAVDASQHVFEFSVEHKSGTTTGELVATFKIDGVQCQDASGNLIEHVITLGTATEMAAIYAAKTGDVGGATASVMTLDRIDCYQTR